MHKNKATFLAMTLFFMFSTLSASGAPADPRQAAFSPIKAADFSEPPKAFISSVKAMWAAKDWDGLEKCAAECRASRTAWSNGVWKLDTFYDLLGAASAEECTGRSEEISLELITKMHDWIRLRPKSITARVALANQLYAFAWEGRGGGWASEVGEEGHKKMRERELAALQVLRDAKLTKELCPRLWLTQVKIEKDQGQNIQTFDKVFDECVNLFPSYHGAYFEKTIELQTFWAGEEGDWEKFALGSADRLGPVEGEKLYAQIVWKMDRTYRKKNVFSSSTVDWARAKRGFELLMTQYPASVQLLNEYCKLSCMVGDTATAKSLFSKLSGRCDSTVWKTAALFDAARKTAFSVGQ